MSNIEEKQQSFEVPTLNLDGIYSDDKQNLKRIATELLKLNAEYGIVHMRNHGLSLDKIQRYFDISDTFFDLPEEKKEKYKRPFTPWHGYAIEHNVVDGVNLEMNQSYDICNTDLWFPDDLVPGFKKTALELFSEVSRLSDRMLVVLDLALDAGGYFQKIHNSWTDKGDDSANMKMLRYPPVPAATELGTLRLMEHFDVPTITLLYTSLEGLQILDKNDHWKTATVIEGALLMQFGKSLEVLSAGKLPAMKHRVVVTEGQRRPGGTRRTLAHFHGPRENVVLTPLDGSTGYGPTSHKEMLDDARNNLYGY